MSETPRIEVEPFSPNTKVESPSSEEPSTQPTLDTAIKDEKEGTYITAEDTKPEDEDIVYPTGLVLAAVALALCLAVFLVCLDQTIIATAIPRITDRFKSVKDIGWYGAVRPQSLHYTVV
jgi:hypothetical protein